jgi:hypothetical protein
MPTIVEVLWDQEWIGSLDDRVDSWLKDLVDDAVDFAAARLREHAPGRIDELVVSDGPQFEPQIGAIEGVAGVTSDPTEQFVSRRGSRRADYPIFVDVGTGIHGPLARPITAFPGHAMGPIEFSGRMIYPTEIRGQHAQDFSGEATRDTDAWLPAHIDTSAVRLSNL